jgi:tetratricopeptide (TPR) repeat protein
MGLVDQEELQIPGGLPIYLDGGVLNRAVAMEGARRAGIEALLVGQVRILESDGQPYGSKTIQFGDPRVRAVIDYELLQVSTGRPLLNGSVESAERIIEDAAGSRGEQKVLRALVEAAAAALANRLVPHEERVELRLESLVYGSGASALRRGNRAAADADWQAAMSHWQRALEQDPGNHAALYNLALAHEARGEFVRAEQLVRAALASSDADRYREALARIGKASSDAQLAMQQHERLRRSAVLLAGNRGAGSIRAGSAGPRWPPTTAPESARKARPRLTRLPAPHVTVR